LHGNARISVCACINNTSSSLIKDRRLVDMSAFRLLFAYTFNQHACVQALFVLRLCVFVCVFVQVRIPKPCSEYLLCNSTIALYSDCKARKHGRTFILLDLVGERISCSFLGACGITYAKVYTHKCRLRMSWTKAYVLWRRASEGREPNVSI
jgi:hypothetical protein